MSKLTAKLYACVPGKVRREYKVTVREEFARAAIRLAMARLDGRAVWSCLMTSPSVDEMSKKTLKMVVLNRCAEMATAMEAWALENPDGSVQTQDSSPDDGR